MSTTITTFAEPQQSTEFIASEPVLHSVETTESLPSVPRTAEFEPPVTDREKTALQIVLERRGGSDLEYHQINMAGADQHVFNGTELIDGQGRSVTKMFEAANGLADAGGDFRAAQDKLAEHYAMLEQFRRDPTSAFVSEFEHRGVRYETVIRLDEYGRVSYETFAHQPRPEFSINDSFSIELVDNEDVVVPVDEPSVSDVSEPETHRVFDLSVFFREGLVLPTEQREASVVVAPPAQFERAKNDVTVRSSSAEEVPVIESMDVAVSDPVVIETVIPSPVMIESQDSQDEVVVTVATTMNEDLSVEPSRESVAVVSVESPVVTASVELQPTVIEPVTQNFAPVVSVDLSPDPVVTRVPIFESSLAPRQTEAYFVESRSAVPEIVFANPKVESPQVFETIPVPRHIDATHAQEVSPVSTAESLAVAEPTDRAESPLSVSGVSTERVVPILATLEDAERIHQNFEVAALAPAQYAEPAPDFFGVIEVPIAPRFQREAQPTTHESVAHASKEYISPSEVIARSLGLRPEVLRQPGSTTEAEPALRIITASVVGADLPVDIAVRRIVDPDTGLTLIQALAA